MSLLIVVFFFSFGLSCWFASSRSPLSLHDMPNERSLHENPVAKTGGIAILTGLAVGWFWIAQSYALPSTLGWIAVAAMMLIHADLAMHDSLLGEAMTCIAIIWILNLYNFMDGMDGFSGGMTSFGFGFLACAGWLHGANEYAMHASLVAALGFLCMNFPPAKIFMGDVGSATLGLLAAAFSLWGIRDGLFAWWFPMLVFSPFIIDATVTLIRRMMNRERIWEAHRSHYYQRLVRWGWGHKKTVLSEYVAMFLAGCSALAALQVDAPVATAAVLAGWSCIYLLIAILVHRHESGAAI